MNKKHMPKAGKRLRVLLIAEAANPELSSVALIGYSLSKAMRDVCDAHLVTEIRNRKSLLEAGFPENGFTAIDNPAQRLGFKISTILRGGHSLGWTIHTAMSTLSYPYFELKLWSHFKESLRRGDYDLVHRITPLTPIAPSPLAGKLAKLGIPYVMGPINGGLPWPQGYGNVRRQEREWLGYVRRLYRCVPGAVKDRKKASALILASCHTYQEVVGNSEIIGRKALWLPENGVDPERFPGLWNPPPPPQPDSPLKVVFVGRLVPYKGAHVLLKAAAPLIREGRLTLKIIGDGPQMPLLRKIANEEQLHTGLELTGNVPHQQVNDEISGGHVYAFPSVREFGGGAVLEAMSLGLMPVVLDYGGPCELVPPTCGITIPVGPKDELIQAYRKVLSELANDPAKVHSYGMRAQAFVREHFTWPAKAAKILRVYRWVTDSCETKPVLMQGWAPSVDTIANENSVDSHV